MSGDGEQSGKGQTVRRIGLITYAAEEPFHAAQMDVAQARLEELGRTEGAAVYRRFFGGRDLALTAKHADEIVDWPADVILSFMTNADLAALAATKRRRIPIVCWSMDPVGAGLVANVTAPGGALTGVSVTPPFPWWQLRFLKALMSDLRQVAHLYNSAYAIAPAALEHLRRAAAMMEVDVRVYECPSADALAPTVTRMARDGMKALIVGPHEMFNARGDLISAAALGEGIASVGLASIGENDGVAGFLPDFDRIWRVAAEIADRVLRGDDPATMPFARHIRPLFMINLRSLERLGLAPPSWLVAEADRIVS